MKALKNKKGFTLMEMLIVVAIIAVLVAIALPVYNDRMHKVRVAADWANLRAYYAEIQLDYMTSGAYNPKVPRFGVTQFDWDTISFLGGEEVDLQAGVYAVFPNTVKGEDYYVSYLCKDHHTDHNLDLQ